MPCRNATPNNAVAPYARFAVAGDRGVRLMEKPIRKCAYFNDNEEWDAHKKYKYL